MPTTRDPELDLSAALASLLYPTQEELLREVHSAGFAQLRACHTVVLGHLERESLRLTDLAVRCGQPKQYIGRLVDELEQLGYLTREADPGDRRSKTIRLTERGTANQREVRRALAAIEGRYAEHLGEKGYRAFKQALLRLAECESGADAPPTH